MADVVGGAASGHPNLNLSPEEKRIYGQLFREADPDGFDVVSGDVAVKFFEKTKLPPDVLGQIWQIADTENRGLLTPPGFGVVLRLIGHAQAGRAPSAELAKQPAPLPRFNGHTVQPLASQSTGASATSIPTGTPPIRVPPLTPDKISEYSSLFEKSGAENGVLSGFVAKQIFERARLPNEVLGKIWNLSDTQGRGALDIVEFAIAMHLLASLKSGVMRGVPNTLPSGLYEAASRRQPARTSTNSQPTPDFTPNHGIAPQFSGYNSGRPMSPIVRQQAGTPLSTQSTGEAWAISVADKARFDLIFAGLDKSNRGFITGDQAVQFFGNARLPEEVLAQIWDLADINSEGQLNRDEFAVAMYLIRQQRGSKDGRGNLPSTLPIALIPPSMRRQQAPPSQPTAPAFENAPVTQPRSAADDLFGLDAFTSTSPQVPQATGESVSGPFNIPKSPIFPPPTSPSATSTVFKPFIPSSSFGQTLNSQNTGFSDPSQSRSVPPQASALDDLLGDADPEISNKLTQETTELANLSNQVGNLSKQMTEVRDNRAAAEQELSQTTQQKREFESRLAQLRTVYEQEVKDVKALQERLTQSRSETKRLQDNIAIIEGSQQDLYNQRQQVAAALEADMQENAALKEKMRQINAEISQMKPQLEKLKSDARQQKGLVAINKKQLATNEAERDRVQADTAIAQADLASATREAGESAKEVEQSTWSAPQTSITSPAQVTSPTPSASSNPFFRRPTDGPFSPPVTNREALTGERSAFDSIFGPSVTPPNSDEPPPVSFKSEIPSQAQNAINESNSAKQELHNPPAPSGSEAVEPPAPPQSRQLTSAALPFRIPLQRGDSISSSVRVAPPASRLSPADTPRSGTPTTPPQFLHSESERPPVSLEKMDPSETVPGPGQTPRPDDPTPTQASERNPWDDQPERLHAEDAIPGAFPSQSTPRVQTPIHEVSSTAVAAGAAAAALATSAGAAAATHQPKESKEPTTQPAETEVKPGNTDSNFDDLFGGSAHSRSPAKDTTDFDSAFANFGKAPAINGDANASKSEFPPIRELEADDSDDSSDAPLGFDDDFNTTSPARPPAKIPLNEGSKAPDPPQVASAVPSFLQVRPTLQTTPSAVSSLPGIDSQSSPPTYGESVSSSNPSHFPPEFKGLLPSREAPTSPTGEGPTGESNIPTRYGPETTKSPPPPTPVVAPSTAPSAAQHHKFSVDDFDSAFAGLDMAPAPVQDDDDEEDEFDAFGSKNNNHGTEFDASFDAPPQPRTSTSIIPPPNASSSVMPNGSGHTQVNASAANDFDNFNSSASQWHSNAAPLSTAPTATATSSSHDWDAIFAGLDGPTPAPAKDVGPAQSAYSAVTSASPTSTLPPPALASASKSPQPTSSQAQTSRPLPSQPASNSRPAPSQPAPASRPVPSQPAPTRARPVPGRALSTGTEHDDPILKRLTAMGWSREDSLSALEKYDYNIDKAADYLTFKT